MKLQLLQAGNQLGRVVMQNAPAILTVTAGVGVVATAALGIRTGVKANRALEELEYTAETAPTIKDKAKVVAPKAIPVILVGGATIFCMFAAQRMNLQRQAALAAALVAANSKFEGYREQVTKELGPNKEEKIMTQMDQEKINKKPPLESGMNLIRTRFGDVLFMDSFTGRYFLSSYEAVNRAAIELTKIAQRDMSASLNDFYNALEIPPTDSGDLLGWNIADVFDESLDAIIPVTTNRVCKTPTPEELPCVVIDYDIEPLIDYDHVI